MNFDSSNNDSVTALPEQMYFEKDSQLVVWNKDKEQFYKLADKIIMMKTDEFIIRHFEDKSRQMLNVTHKDIIKGVRDSSDGDVWGVTRPSDAEFAAVTGRSNQLVKPVTHRNITKKSVTDTSDDDVSGVTRPSDAEFAAVTGRSNQLVKPVTHRNITKESVTDTSDDNVLGVTRPSVAEFAAVTGKSNKLVKHVTHRNITNEYVTDDIDYELPGVTKKILDEFECVTCTTGDFIKGETDTTWEVEEAVTAQADVPEKEMSTSKYTAGKAGYYLHKKGIDITILLHEEIEELEEELELDFEENESVNSDIPYILKTTTTPPLDKSSDMVVYDITDQEDLKNDKHHLI